MSVLKLCESEAVSDRVSTYEGVAALRYFRSQQRLSWLPHTQMHV